MGTYGSQQTSVEAFTCKVDQLLRGEIHTHTHEKELRYPLKIDRYQRPYVWSEKKVRQLLEDLKSHNETKGAYYLGSILLHENSSEDKSGLYVIDGQQRLTTLLLLYRILFKGKINSEIIKLSYYHQESFKNIQSAKELIETHLSGEEIKDEIRDTLLELEITIIKTDDIDLAFTFFDSQNSRGVRLRATDLLKSYHLREINQLNPDNEHDRKYLERNSARRWEHLQTFKGILSTEHDFAFELFHKLIWRARRWKGADVEKESRETVIEEFQEGAIRDTATTSTEIPLYPNRHNMLSERLVESKDGGLRRAGGHIRVSEKSSLLPFTLRQPIHSGLHYFLFGEKYAELMYELFREETEDDTIEKFRNYFVKIVEENSYYLKELFMVCVVTYYDKYGTDWLYDFAELLGLAHGIKRMEQYYIFRQSALKYMREYNLVDVISHSFRPEEVIMSLKDHIIGEGKERTTSQVDLTDEDLDLVLDKSGVNERCYNAFQEYYDLDWRDLLGENREELNLTEFARTIINSDQST